MKLTLKKIAAVLLAAATITCALPCYISADGEPSGQVDGSGVGEGSVSASGFDSDEDGGIVYLPTSTLTVEPGDRFDVTVSADIGAEKSVTGYAVTLTYDNGYITAGDMPIECASNASDYSVFHEGNVWVFTYGTPRTGLAGDLAVYSFCAGGTEGTYSVTFSMVATYADSTSETGDAVFTLDIAEAEHISTPTALAALSDADGYYKLDCDIDMTGTNRMRGDGSSDGKLYPFGFSRFSGTFDGCGHTVSGFTGELFAENFGRIINLTLDDVSGSCASFCISNEGLIENCVNLSDITSGRDYKAAGICMYNYGDIVRCVNYGDIEYSGENGVAGGIAGMGDSAASFRECANYGSVASTNPEHGSYAGGICGFSMGCLYENVYNGGTVNSTYKAAGIIGCTSENTMINVLNTGSSSSDVFGGIAASSINPPVAMSGVYYLSTSAAAPICADESFEENVSDYGTAITAANLADETKLDGFDFFYSPDVSYTWTYTASDTYPVLKNIPAVNGHAEAHLTGRRIYSGRRYNIELVVDSPVSASGLLIDVKCGSGNITFNPEDITISDSCQYRNDIYPVIDKMGRISVMFSGLCNLSGTVITIPVILSSDTPNGSYTVSCELLYVDDGNSYRTLTVSDSSLRVIDYVVGDINEDCRYNTTDAVTLLWYYILNYYNPVRQQFIPEEANIDYNGDGYENSSDAVWLLWNVFLPDQYPLYPD